MGRTGYGLEAMGERATGEPTMPRHDSCSATEYSVSYGLLLDHRGVHG